MMPSGVTQSRKEVVYMKSKTERGSRIQENQEFRSEVTGRPKSPQEPSPVLCFPPEVEQGFETKNLKGQHVPGSLDNLGISMQLTFEFSMHTYYDSLKCYSDIFFLLNII